MNNLSAWWPTLAVTLVACVLIRSAFDVAGQFQAQRDLANTERDEARAEVRRLKSLVESRTQQLGLWMTRAFEAGWQPMLSEDQAQRVMRDLFAEKRPMGACPSTVEDAERARRWRESRALASRDHTTRHSVEAVCDSEAATEIMHFCVGGLEVEGE